MGGRNCFESVMVMVTMIEVGRSRRFRSRNAVALYNYVAPDFGEVRYCVTQLSGPGEEVRSKIVQGVRR